MLLKNGRIPEDLCVGHVRELEQLFDRAVCEALWRHKRLKQSVVSGRDGKVVVVAPDDIPVEDDAPVW